jgi:sterol desaturase/sphingolipid hydroxylase (fatty acid hydroxylase superfamily)
VTLNHILSELAGPARSFAVLAAVLGFCLAAERFAPGRESRPGGRTLNLGVGLVSMVIAVVSSGSVGALATLAVNAAGGGWIVLPSSGWGLAAGCLVYLLAMDLGEYLFHRAQHAVPALWAMHSLHHSDPAFGATTTVRHFWLEPLIKTLTTWLAVGLVFKASPAIVTVYAAASYYNYWTHSNVRVGYGRASWLLNSPQYHRLHHSASPEHFDCNYAALLPIFDLISGAYRRPARGEYPATGLDTAEHPRSFVQAVIWPLRDRRASQARPTSATS